MKVLTSKYPERNKFSCLFVFSSFFGITSKYLIPKTTKKAKKAKNEVNNYEVEIHGKIYNFRFFSSFRLFFGITSFSELHPLFYIDKLLNAAIVVDGHGALLDGAVADIDVRGGIDIEDVGGTIDEALALTGTLVVLSTGIIGHLAQSELAIDNVDVVNLARHIATDEGTVLGGADHVAEPDVSHLTA